MAGAAKRLYPIVPLCVAAIGFAPPPAAGAERNAAHESLAGQIAISRTITLDLARDAPMMLSLPHVRVPARGRAGETRLFVTAFGGSGGGKSLRIDLFRFEVSRARANADTAGLAGRFPASVLRIGLTEGPTPQSKAVGIAMHLAPNLVLESRLGPAGESDTELRFKLRF